MRTLLVVPLLTGCFIVDPCAPCDPDEEFCVVYGRDDGRPTGECRALPPECLDDRTCECLEGTALLDDELACVWPEQCEDDGKLVREGCPGEM